MTRVLVIALAALVLAGCGGAKSRYTSHMSKGKQLFEENNLDKAGIEFRNALQIDPKAAEALYYTGRVTERKGEPNRALGLYQAAVDAQPDYTAARASLGRIYVFGGLPEQALTAVAPGLVKHPDDADLLTVRGAARDQLKNTDGAVADAERAVQIDPKNGNAVALLAALKRKAGDAAGAIALVSDAVGRIENSAELRQVLASLYLQEKQPDKAEEQLRKVVELRPTELRNRYQLALFYARSHKIDEAQHVLEDAVKSQPKSDEAKLALVDFVLAQRSPEEGEKTLRAFIASKPDDYDLRLGLGGLLQRTGKPKEALAAYQEVIDRSGTGPQGLTARSRIAAVYVAEGRGAEAQKLIDEVLAKNPRDNDALLLRGNLSLDRKDTAAAIVDLRAVLRDQPGAIGVRRLLARAYLANGEAALAEEALRAAMDAAPDAMMVRVELAQVLSQTQRVEQAATLLEEAVRYSPNAPEPREALVRVYLAKGDFAAARTSAEDLQTLRPDSPIGFYLAGLAERGQNHLDNSAKALEHALQLQPDAADVLTALVSVQLAQGHSAQAVSLVQAAAEREPKNVAPLNLLGEVFVATHDFKRAEEVLNRAIALDPRSWVSYRTLGLARLGAKDTAGAIAAYEAGVKTAPDQPQLAADLATLYERNNRVDSAISLYDSLQKRSPKAAYAANNLAMLLVTYRSKDKASMDRARDLTANFATSDNGALLDTSGWVRFKRGEYGEALPVLERAVERAPDAKVIRYHLAMAELQAGHRDRARQNLETALAGGASFSGADEARSALAELKSSSG
ncbi:MAG: tetratricopeptide repeat protein [Gammaproteobacteria bacterium]